MLDLPAPDSPSRADRLPGDEVVEHVDTHPSRTEVTTTATPGSRPAPRPRRPRGRSNRDRPTGEDHHRLGPGVVGDGGSPLDPAVLHRAVEAAHQEEAVDVGGQLLLTAAVGGPPTEQRSAGEDRDHLVVDESDPVAHGGLGVHAESEHHGPGAVVQRDHQPGAVVADHRAGRAVGPPRRGRGPSRRPTRGPAAVRTCRPPPSTSGRLAGAEALLELEREVGDHAAHRHLTGGPGGRGSAAAILSGRQRGGRAWRRNTPSRVGWA